MTSNTRQPVRPMNWREVTDQVLNTGMSMRAQADRALARANGEPEYVSPSEAAGRLVKTDPIGMRATMIASLFSGKAYWWGHMAMLLQAQRMPGPWFGDREMTDAEKAAGLKHAPRFGKHTDAATIVQLPVLLAGLGIAQFYFSASLLFLGWLSIGATGLLIGWIEYYVRRTNRKEVVFASGIVFGLLRLVLGVASGRVTNQAQRVYEGKMHDYDYSQGYDPALIAQMNAEERAANQANGVWNPLDYGA